MTRANSVYERLRSDIVNGVLSPGERVTELHLAEALHVSQGPIREAFARLRQEGLLVSLAHRGTFVSDSTLDEARHISEVRRHLESYAGRLATKHVTDEHLQTLKREVEQIERANHVGNVGDAVAADMRFHAQIIEMAGSAFLSNVWNMVAGRTQQFLVFYIRLRDEQGRHPFRSEPDSHWPLLRLVAAGDGDGLAAALDAHILAAWSNLDDLTGASID